MLEPYFELRGLEDLGFMFALRDFLVGYLLFAEEEELEGGDFPSPPELNVLDLLDVNTRKIQGRKTTRVSSVHGVETLFSFKFLDLVVGTGTGEIF